MSDEEQRIDTAKSVATSNLDHHHEHDELNVKVEPWTVFSRNQKYLIIALASVAGIFSPISSSIYFPAIQTLARDFDKSTSQINLTITVYMILQGLAPAFFTDLADNVGKRPVYMITFCIYLAANIGLALQNSYGALMGLRALQSTGSSVTAALAMSAAGDIAKGSERGQYVGIIQSGVLFGPAIGPIIGGLLAGSLGWRAIFWFLTICAGVFLVVYVLFGLESARSIVGNGSIRPPPINQSVFQLLSNRRRRVQELSSNGVVTIPERKWHIPNPARSFSIFLEKDLGCILLYSALLMAAAYQVTASTVTIFQDIYGYNDTIIGVCYLPFGIGSMIGSLGGGRIFDVVLRRYAAKHDFDVDRANSDERSLSFPMTQARLLVVIPFSIAAAVFLIAYGWSVQARLNVAAPLVFQFFFALCFGPAASGTGIMLLDSYPARSASASAANNIGRCLLGAGATAVIQPMLEAMGRGWTFTFDGLMLIALLALLWPSWQYGAQWRRERLLRESAGNC